MRRTTAIIATACCGVIAGSLAVGSLEPITAQLAPTISNEPPDTLTVTQRLRGELRAERRAHARTKRRASRLARANVRLRAQIASERRPNTYARASAYGPGLYGNPLGCGGTLHGNSNVVAHKTAPCGAEITIYYGEQRVRSVVGDRGPFVGGRDMDLGPGVWRALGFTSARAFGVRTVGVS
jgi:rare lipoprotein A (peptidoglycan hydrolase)